MVKSSSPSVGSHMADVGPLQTLTRITRRSVLQAEILGVSGMTLADYQILQTAGNP